MRQLPLLLISLGCAAACGDDASENPHVDASVDSSSVADASPDSAPDAADRLQVVSSFDPTLGQLPEGLTIAGGVPYVGLAPLGQIYRIPASGIPELYGSLPAPVADTYTLGVAMNAAGELLVGVGAAGPNPTPAPGVYRIPAGGGAATLFASSPQMFFPNGLAFSGTDLYVTDSAAGRVFKIGPQGQVQTWLNDPVLQGDLTACGGTGGTFAIGANGIVFGPTDVYIAVTDFGRVVRVPIGAGGTAGTPVTITESCTGLQGADGIARQADGTLLVARNGLSNSIASVTITGNGSVTDVFATGAPLDGPASLAIDTPNNRVLVTSSAFFSGATGHPSVVGVGL